MPRIPDVGERRAPAYGGSPVAPDYSAVGKGLEIAGREMEKVGEAYQQAEDQTAIEGFRRRMNDWQAKNVYDPESGAITRQGKNAFGLQKELPESFDKFVDSEMANVSSPRQAQYFSYLAGQRRDQVSDWANNHVFQESERYHVGEYQAAQASSVDHAGNIADDEGLVRTELQLIRERAADFATKRGRSQVESDRAAQEEIQKAHSGVMANLISRNNYQTAEKYFGTFASEFDPGQRAEFNARLNDMRGARRSISVVDDALKSYGPRAYANADVYTRLKMGTRLAESGNKDFRDDGSAVIPVGADGQPLSTARFAMQVLDGTARDPGFGIKPAADLNDPAERNRVGEELLGVYLDKYDGDIEKVSAAYTMGSKWVDDAIVEGGEAWKNELPAEKRKYVDKVAGFVGDPGAGGGERNERVTAQQVDEYLRTQLADDPKALAMARQEYNVRQQNEKDTLFQEQEDTLTKAYDLMDQGTSYAQLPDSIRQVLTPANRDRAANYELRDRKATNWEYYDQISGDPTFLKKQSIAQMKENLSESQLSRWIDIRNGIKPGDQRWTALESRDEYIKATLGRALGLQPGSAKVKNTFGQFKAMLGERVTLDDSEEKFKAEANRLTTEVILNKSWFPGGTRTPLFMVDTDPEIAQIVVPPDIRGQIMRGMASEFNKIPAGPGRNAQVDAMVKKAYWLSLRMGPVEDEGTPLIRDTANPLLDDLNAEEESRFRTLREDVMPERSPLYKLAQANAK